MAAPDDPCPDPKDVSALILGAGSGQRLGGVYKSFLEIDGVTLIERAVRLVTPFAAQVLVALPAEQVERGRSLLGATAARVFAGGATRQESLEGLLARATGGYVLIHDAARPFATARQVATVLGSARRHGAAVSVLRASARDPVAVTSADRESLAEAVPNERAVWTRTPSAFRRDWLTAALAKADNEGRSESSTAALVLAAGFPVRAVDDAPDNVKITVPEDLALLKPSPAR